MRKKALVYGICLLGTVCTLSAKDKKGGALYKDAKAPIEKRVDDLLSRMTLEEKVMQLNQYTLGRNNNVNNVGEEVKKVPAEIGSLIYFETNPELRNNMQKKAMEESRLGIPIIFGYDAIHGFRTVFRWRKLVPGIRIWWNRRVLYLRRKPVCREWTGRSRR